MNYFRTAVLEIQSDSKIEDAWQYAKSQEFVDMQPARICIFHKKETNIIITGDKTKCAGLQLHLDVRDKCFFPRTKVPIVRSCNFASNVCKSFTPNISDVFNGYSES